MREIFRTRQAVASESFENMVPRSPDVACAANMCSNTLNERSSVFIGEAAAGVGEHKVYSDVLEGGTKENSCGGAGQGDQRSQLLSSSPG